MKKCSFNDSVVFTILPASYDDKEISNLEDDRVIWDRQYTLKVGTVKTLLFKVLIRNISRNVSYSNLNETGNNKYQFFSPQDLSSIEVKIQRADSPTSPNESFFLPITDDCERSRSPELLYPPIANIVEVMHTIYFE